MHDALIGIDVPTVFIGDLPNAAVDSVKIDDFGGGYQMGAYLAKRGHKRIAHVTGPSFFAEAMARAAGFEQGLRDHGVEPLAELRREGTYLSPSGREAVEWLLATSGDHLPSVVFFGNFLMAAGGDCRIP
ncbi:substrate-binding domain-containing protein (plasmid) [Sinorhizobium meliloti]|nr:substrate-binding domain-containing protein [Sinorhizobium meliloti]